jgi:hypothetical protein
MRAIVKVRVVAGATVIGIPKRVLKATGLKSGDYVIIESGVFSIHASKA